MGVFRRKVSQHLAALCRSTFYKSGVTDTDGQAAFHYFASPHLSHMTEQPASGDELFRAVYAAYNARDVDARNVSMTLLHLAS